MSGGAAEAGDRQDGEVPGDANAEMNVEDALMRCGNDHGAEGGRGGGKPEATGSDADAEIDGRRVKLRRISEDAAAEAAADAQCSGTIVGAAGLEGADRDMEGRALPRGERLRGLHRLELPRDHNEPPQRDDGPAGRGDARAEARGPSVPALHQHGAAHDPWNTMGPEASSLTCEANLEHGNGSLSSSSHEPWGPPGLIGGVLNRVALLRRQARRLDDDEAGRADADSLAPSRGPRRDRVHQQGRGGAEPCGEHVDGHGADSRLPARGADQAGLHCAYPQVEGAQLWQLPPAWLYLPHRGVWGGMTWGSAPKRRRTDPEAREGRGDGDSQAGEPDGGEGTDGPDSADDTSAARRGCPIRGRVEVSMQPPGPPPSNRAPHLQPHPIRGHVDVLGSATTAAPSPAAGVPPWLAARHSAIQRSLDDHADRVERKRMRQPSPRRPSAADRLAAIRRRVALRAGASVASAEAGAQPAIVPARQLYDAAVLDDAAAHAASRLALHDVPPAPVGERRRLS